MSRICSTAVAIGVLWAVLAPASDGRAATITRLSPNTVQAGSGDVEILISGADFTRNSTVRWNGTQLGVTFVGSTRLKLEVPAGLAASPGSAEVMVVDEVSSDILLFNVVTTPVPAILKAVPASAAAGDKIRSITILGANFTRYSIVQWNGRDLVTTLKPPELNPLPAGGRVARFPHEYYPKAAQSFRGLLVVIVQGDSDGLIVGVKTEEGLLSDPAHAGGTRIPPLSRPGVSFQGDGCTAGRAPPGWRPHKKRKQGRSNSRDCGRLVPPGTGRPCVLSIARTCPLMKRGGPTRPHTRGEEP